MTPNKHTLKSLLERVKEAEGADRELDGYIARDVDGLPFGFCGDGDGTWVCFNCLSTKAYLEDGWAGCGEPLGIQDERTSYPMDWREDERLPHYTSSIDAALSLVERVLPGWWWLREDGVSIRLVGPDNGDFYPSATGKHNKVPLAILSALLQALIAQEGE